MNFDEDSSSREFVGWIVSSQFKILKTDFTECYKESNKMHTGICYTYF